MIAALTAFAAPEINHRRARIVLVAGIAIRTRPPDIDDGGRRRATGWRRCVDRDRRLIGHRRLIDDRGLIDHRNLVNNRRLINHSRFRRRVRLSPNDEDLSGEVNGREAGGHQWKP